MDTTNMRGGAGVASPEADAQVAGPSVSIVMATLDQNPLWLGHAIQSCLLQEWPPAELIIVTLKEDTNLPALKQMRSMFGDDRMRIVIADRANPYHQRNVGLKKARGDLVTFCDSDDVLLPNKLWLEASIVSAKQGSLVYTGFFYGDEHMNIIASYKHEGYSRAEMRRKCCIPDYAMIPRKVWEEIGFLEPEYQSASVYDALLKIIERHEDGIFYRRVPTWIYRQRHGQLSQKEALDPSQLERRTQVLRLHYERCKEEPPEGAFAVGPFTG